MLQSRFICKKKKKKKKKGNTTETSQTVQSKDTILSVLGIDIKHIFSNSRKLFNERKTQKCEGRKGIQNLGYIVTNFNQQAKKVNIWANALKIKYRCTRLMFP